jgi:hypothetical protein
VEDVRQEGYELIGARKTEKMLRFRSSLGAVFVEPEPEVSGSNHSHTNINTCGQETGFQYPSQSPLSISQANGEFEEEIASQSHSLSQSTSVDSLTPSLWLCPKIVKHQNSFSDGMDLKALLGVCESICVDFDNILNQDFFASNAALCEESTRSTVIKHVVYCLHPFSRCVLRIESPPNSMPNSFAYLLFNCRWDSCCTTIVSNT